MITQRPAPHHQNESPANTTGKPMKNRNHPPVRHPTRKPQPVPNTTRATAAKGPKHRANQAEKILCRKICANRPRKDKRPWWDSKQNECLYRSSRSEKFRKIAGKKRLQRRCFPVNFAKFVRTFFFAEHHRTATSDYGSINSIEGRINKRNGKL